MEYLNRVELVGVVGDYKENDIFCRMTVCTNYAYQNGKDSKIETMWHNVLSNKKYEGISKGCCVKVVGRIRYSNYYNSNGEECRITEIIALDIEKVE